MLQTIATYKSITDCCNSLFGSHTSCNDLRVKGVYCNALGGDIGIEIIDYVQYGVAPAYSFAEGFDAETARDLYYAVRASMRRLTYRHAKAGR